MAKVKIRRVADGVGMLRNYKVVLDGKTIGKVGYNETKEFDISEGQHLVWLRIDWCRSKKVIFSVHRSDAMSFEAGTTFADERMLKALWHGLVVPWDHLWLKEASEVAAERARKAPPSVAKDGGPISKLAKLIIGGVVLALASIFALVGYIMLPGRTSHTAVRAVAVFIVALAIVNGITIGLWLSKRMYGIKKL